MEPGNTRVVMEDTILPELKGIVSLAYEGADLSHVELVAPDLSAREFRGSFFLNSESALAQAARWQAIQLEGHEMGSGTFLGFTDARGNLHNWTLDMVREDLRMSRSLLTELFPRQPDFAFAYPGDQSLCVADASDPREVSFRSVVDEHFRVATMPIDGLNSLTTPEIHRLKSVHAASIDISMVEGLISASEHQKQWLILRFGPVGTGDEGVDLRFHRRILDLLDSKRQALEIKPVYGSAMKLTLPSTMAFVPQHETIVQ